MWIGIGIGIGRTRYGTGGTPTQLLLDEYSGAAAAYSLRQLKSGVTNAIEVRRSADDTTQDIGFVDGELDTASLEEFVNCEDVAPADHGSGAAAAYSLRYVSASYTGDVIQVRRSSDDTTQDFNPTEITDGTLATFCGAGDGFVTTWYDQSGNGNDATQTTAANQPQIVSSGVYLGFLDFNNSDTLLSTTATYTATVDTTFQVAQATTGRNVFGAFEGTGRYYGVAESGNTGSPHHNSFTNVNYYVNSSTLITPTRDDLWNELSVSKSLLTVTLGSEVDDSGVRLGYASSWINQNLYEFILYNSDQSSNRPKIEANINNYYSIYANTNNGFVTTWYDQSGNGNDAEQTTAASQPQIVSSGSVITENGKPAAQFDGSNNFLSVSLTSVLAQPNSIIITHKFDNLTDSDHDLIDSYPSSDRTLLDTTSGTYRLFAGSSQVTSYIANTSQTLAFTIFNSSSSLISINNNVTSGFNTGTQGLDSFNIGNTSTNYLLGSIQEIVIYNSDQSSNRTGIETNINDFYSIYYVATNSEYQAVLDYADSQGYQRPSYAQCALQDALVGDLKDAGVWSKLDTFAVFATDGDEDFALIDWIRLSQYSAINSPTFTTDVGFTGDGSSAYMNTNFNLLNDSVNYQQDSASKFGWINGTPSDNDPFDGVSNFGNYNSVNIRNLNSSQWRINANSNSTSSGDNFGTDYFLNYYRDGSTSSGFFNNTTLEVSDNTRASSSLVNATQIIMAGQSSWGFSSLTISAYGMGDDLSAENTDLYNALDTYLTSI